MPETTDTSSLVSTDTSLLAAVDLARTALLEITSGDTIGEVIGHVDETDGVVSLLFDCLMTGYPGWRWTVSLARVDETSDPKVLETELTPGNDALLAPPWVPWAERLTGDDTSDDDDDYPGDEPDEDDSDSDSDDDYPGDEPDEDDSDSDSDDDYPDEDEDEDDSDSDGEAVNYDEDGALDALNGIDFDEALAAAELHPRETAEAEADTDHGAPQPPTRSRRARRA